MTERVTSGGPTRVLFHQAVAAALLAAAVSAQESKPEPKLNANLPAAAPLIELQTGFEKLADKVGPAVVTIATKKRVGSAGGEQAFLDKIPDEEYERLFGRKKPKAGEEGKDRFANSAGSGVIISADGLILTNQHVVEDAVEIEVATAARRRYAAKIVGVDNRSDLAVIRVDAKALPAAALGDAGKVRVGHWAVAMGNPFGISHDGKASLTVGVVSAVGRYLGGRAGGEDRYYGNLIQTDASINPGNSGGPLLNVYGEVIGINTVISTRSGGSEGVGFAIPIDAHTRGIVAALSRGEEVEYGFLGVSIQTPTEKECEESGVAPGYGALIAFCEPGGPGDKAGLRRGDIVVSFRGERVLDKDQLVRLVGATPVGHKTEVVLHRNKVEMTINVEVAKRKLATVTGVRPEPDDWRGLSVRDITPADRTKLKLPATMTGVIIERIRPNSAAAHASAEGDKAKLAAGDVIVKIDQTAINNLADFRNAVKAAKGTASLMVTGKPPIPLTEE